MSNRGNSIGGLRREQSLNGAVPTKAKETYTPEANTAPLMRPEQMPRTVRNFSPDFQQLRFVETQLATYKFVNSSTGDIERRRGVIAHMASDSGDPDGAHAQIDSHYTLRDLIEGGHPGAGKIASIMNMQTDSCIIAETGRAPEPTRQVATPKVGAQNNIKQIHPHMSTATVDV